MGSSADLQFLLADVECERQPIESHRDIRIPTRAPATDLVTSPSQDGLQIHTAN